MAITLDGTNGITAPAVTNNGAYTGDGISFADATPSNTLVTTTGGNVGVGTSSPTYRLDVQGTSPAFRVKTAAASTGFILDQSNSTSLVSLINYDNADMRFGTNATERMRIDSSGNLLVGTTSSPEKLCVVTSGSNNVGRFQVGVNGNGIIMSNASGTTVGSITINSSSTAYNTSSDYRLKENVAPMTGALATVSALKPVTYTWKADGSASQGFIAHELAEVVPDCVTGEKDAVDAEGNPVYQGIDTSFLVATLTAAIQELKAELDTVKTELATLKGTV